MAAEVNDGETGVSLNKLIAALQFMKTEHHFTDGARVYIGEDTVEMWEKGHSMCYGSLSLLFEKAGV